MENQFKPGDIVYAKKPTDLKLVVRRFVDKVYHCRVYNHPESREMTYSENELRASTNPAEKKHYSEL